jgi:roadblock/LC7 domain-containing protein
VSELDDLLSADGVFMAGRFGPDGRITEHKSKGLYVEIPAITGMTQWFCDAINMMFSSMAYAIDSMTQSGFNETSWLPVRSWTYSGGDYAISVHGDRFVIAERAKFGSLDELNRLMSTEQP